MNAIVLGLLKNNIAVALNYNHETSEIEYTIDGFYKSGTVLLIDKGEKLIAISRYNEQTDIFDLIDLVQLNYSWWNTSKDRFSGWRHPDPKWIPLLEKYGFITKKTETITTYI